MQGSRALEPPVREERQRVDVYWGQLVLGRSLMALEDILFGEVNVQRVNRQQLRDKQRIREKLLKERQYEEKIIAHRIVIEYAKWLYVCH